MRFACFLIEHLPIRLERLRNPQLRHNPLVVLRPWDEHVLDASPSAVASKVIPGDSRRRVEQLCPQATIISADDPLYQMTHSAAEASLANFSGIVEIRALGEYIIEISSLLSTFHSEEELATQLLTQIKRAAQLTAALGIAGNKFTAVQASQQATSETSSVLIVPNGKEKEFLAPLPLSSLPNAPAELLRRLRLFGITTLGGFARLPNAAIIHQFGTDLAIFHELARGSDPRPLAPKSPPPIVTRKVDLPQIQSDQRLLLNHLARLVRQLAADLYKSGFHTTALTLSVTDDIGQEYVIGAAIKPPVSDIQKLQRLAGQLLEKLSIQSTASELRLIAYPLREWHLGGRQLTLFKSYDRQPSTQLQQVLHSLRQRFGEAVIRLASTMDPPSPIPVHVRCQSDGTPISLRLRRSKWSHRVERTYEYWRELWSWWDHPVTREYYQVEVNDGLIFTLFRDDGGHWFLDRRRM